MSFLTLIIHSLIKEITPKVVKWLASKKYFIFIILLTIPLCLSIVIGARYVIGYDEYIREYKRSLAQGLIKDLVKKCGNGSAVSLSVVSITSDRDNFNNETYKAKFQSAFAMEANIITRLKDQNPELYSNIANIDSPMYNFLLSLDKNSLSTPATFNLNPNLIYQQTPFSFINLFLSKTEWGQNHKLKKLYITSIVKSGFDPLSDRVIYTITFTKSIDFDPKNGCDEVISSLRDLKNKIRDL